MRRFRARYPRAPTDVIAKEESFNPDGRLIRADGHPPGVQLRGGSRVVLPVGRHRARRGVHAQQPDRGRYLLRADAEGFAPGFTEVQVLPQRPARVVRIRLVQQSSVADDDIFDEVSDEIGPE